MTSRSWTAFEINKNWYDVASQRINKVLEERCENQFYNEQLKISGVSYEKHQLVIFEQTIGLSIISPPTKALLFLQS